MRDILQILNSEYGRIVLDVCAVRGAVDEISHGKFVQNDRQVCQRCDPRAEVIPHDAESIHSSTGERQCDCTPAIPWMMCAVVPSPIKGGILGNSAFGGLASMTS